MVSARFAGGDDLPTMDACSPEIATWTLNPRLSLFLGHSSLALTLRGVSSANSFLRQQSTDVQCASNSGGRDVSYNAMFVRIALGVVGGRENKFQYVDLKICNDGNNYIYCVALFRRLKQFLSFAFAK